MRNFLWYLSCVLLFISGGLAFAQVQHNAIPEVMISQTELLLTTNLTFDPDIDVPFPKDTPILVYDPAGGNGITVTAMEVLELTNYTVKSVITAEDLQDYPILVVGWNYNGNMTGLSKSAIEAGITGRVILTGHDADFHTGSYGLGGWRPAAAHFMAQSMGYVLNGGGTGMVAMADATGGFELDTRRLVA